MKYALSIAFGLLLVPALLAQSGVIFECQTPGLFPVYPAVDCEGVSAKPSTGSLAMPSVANIAQCGFPGAGGLQYAFLPANGISTGGPNPPPGGPIVRPLAGPENEIRIPIPVGATGVTFQWEFWNAEGGGSSSWNDTFTVELVNPSTGLAVGPPLVYADTWTSLGTCLNTNPAAATYAQEVGAPAGVTGGPQICNKYWVVPPYPGSLPPGTYLSVVCLNGADSAVISSGSVDDLIWHTNSPCQWTFDQPTGTGSLRVAMSACNPFDYFLVPVSFTPGAYPNGWLFGVDIDILSLVIELNFGPPFFGNLDASGAYTFFVPAGIPSGINFYAGCGFFNAANAQPGQVLLPVHLLSQ